MSAYIYIVCQNLSTERMMPIFRSLILLKNRFAQQKLVAISLYKKMKGTRVQTLGELRMRGTAN